MARKTRRPAPPKSVRPGYAAAPRILKTMPGTLEISRPNLGPVAEPTKTDPTPPLTVTAMMAPAGLFWAWYDAGIDTMRGMFALNAALFEHVFDATSAALMLPTKDLPHARSA